jgi:DNA polymerase-3 subunit chi
MTDISFYHLTTRSLENALPKLLELTLKSGERAVILTGSNARVEALNDHLWSYEPNSWLPHGSNIDGEEAEQPIYLTTTVENPNNATFLFLIDGAVSNQIQTFKRVFELFDGRDKELVEAARRKWKLYKESGHVLSYWKQGEDGKWSKAD